MSIAVVTGAHPIDVRRFQDTLKGATERVCHFQSLYEFCTDSAEARHSYEAIVFYHWHLDTPEIEPEEWWKRGTREALEDLGSGQGIVMLHHSIVAFPAWETWDELCGFTGRGDFSYHQDQIVPVSVVDADHPITRGLSDFVIEDEVYLMKSPQPHEVTPLLMADHPLSMSTIGWTHEYGESRVFSLQLGHGPTAYGNSSFQRVLRNAIDWVVSP